MQVARRKAYVLLSGGESLQITQRAHTPGVNSPARAVFHLHLTKCQLIFHAVLSNPPAGRERRHNVSVRFISFLGLLETVRRKLRGGVGWGGWWVGVTSLTLTYESLSLTLDPGLLGLAGQP